MKAKPGEARKWLEEHVAYDGADCLIWPFFRHPIQGHALVRHSGRPQPAGRVMCELTNGPPSTPRLQAAHSCGNGHEGCVNPKHLRWATSKENMADQTLHGTRVIGSRVGSSKLTERQVTAIREFAHNVRTAALADLFGVSIPTIYEIKRRATWSHI